jgi:hypothetical protein
MNVPLKSRALFEYTTPKESHQNLKKNKNKHQQSEKLNPSLIFEFILEMIRE